MKCLSQCLAQPKGCSLRGSVAIIIDVNIIVLQPCVSSSKVSAFHYPELTTS